MIYFRTCLITLITYCLYLSPLSAQAKDTWVEIGSAKASLSTDRATIATGKGEKFQKIRFRLSGGDATLMKVKIYLNNGQSITEGLQKFIRRDETSRAIPLTNTQQQSFRKVEIFYNLNLQESASVEPKITLMGIPASLTPAASPE